MDLIKHDIPALMGKLAGELSNLARDEVAVAKIELRQSAKEAAVDGAAMAGGASLAYAGLLFVLMAGMFALSSIMPLWGAALLIGILSLIVGGVAMGVAAKRFKTEMPGLEQTRLSMKANAYHLKERITA
jgi:hypothetical protein